MFGSIFPPFFLTLHHPKQRRTQTTLTEARILGPKWHRGSGPEQGTQVAIRRAFGAERAVQDLEVSAVFCRFFGVSKKKHGVWRPFKIRQVYVQCECWGDWKVVGKFIYLSSGVMETRKLCKAGRSRSSSHVVTLEKKMKETWKERQMGDSEAAKKTAVLSEGTLAKTSLGRSSFAKACATSARSLLQETGQLKIWTT